MNRPELGKVSVGDKFLVIPAPYYRRQADPIPVIVTKAARVWLDLESLEAIPGVSTKRTWRLRKDTQDDGTQGSYHDRFVTHEQHAWDERLKQAVTYLRDSGIDVNWKSPWCDRRLELANLLRQRDDLPAF